ncbi:MAG: hypothetical protein PHP74_03585, partial [Candidatus Gracilibacteria bacterium]|nr:hypothetical protein [Candidatus Gracilibacteria bacterium]
MSDDTKKSEEKEKPEKSLKESVDGAEKLLKENKSRISKAYKNAMEKSFGTAWHDKWNVLKWPKNVPLFIGNFFKELLTVQEEKEEVKEEAESELTKEVVESSDIAETAENLVEKIDTENNFTPDEKEAVATLTEDFVEATKATGAPSKIFNKISKLNDHAEKNEEKPEELSEQDMRLAFSTGLFTMVRLRERFNTKEKLENFLTKVKSASDKNPKFKKLSLYIKNNFMKMFQFKAGMVTEIPGLLGVNGLIEKPLLTGKIVALANAKDKLNDGLDLFLPLLFPKTIKDKGLAPMRKMFKDLYEKRNNLKPAEIAELIHSLDENDLRTLAKRIGGANVVSLASVKETANR